MDERFDIGFKKLKIQKVLNELNNFLEAYKMLINYDDYDRQNLNNELDKYLIHLLELKLITNNQIQKYEIKKNTHETLEIIKEIKKQMKINESN